VLRPGTWRKPDNRANVEVDSIVDSYGATTAWALRYSHQDAEFAPRQWTIDVGVVAHIKFGSKAPRLLRIHFALDRDSQRVIVGHCGDHLDTAGTRRRGDKRAADRPSVPARWQQPIRLLVARVDGIE
jgi:hypothetical protein